MVDESISSSAGLRQFLKSDDEQSFFGLRGGGIGWGLAGGDRHQARAARPPGGRAGRRRQRHVHLPIAVAAAHDHVPVIFIILNNSSYRILKQRTNAMRRMPPRRTISSAWTWSRRASTMSAWRARSRPGERADTVAGVCALLKTALAGKEPMPDRSRARSHLQADVARASGMPIKLSIAVAAALLPRSRPRRRKLGRPADDDGSCRLPPAGRVM
ncbi:MAG: hypothetical protein WDO24_22715 [Pseudomonadota bacterium]